MSSTKKLVENECGSQNSFVKLTSHFTSDRSLINQDGLRNNRHQVNNLSQNFVNEYFSKNEKLNSFAPNTFQMDNLLNEERKKQKVNFSNSIADDWISDFSKSNRNNVGAIEKTGSDVKWSTEYLTQTESTLYNDKWEDSLRNNMDPKLNFDLFNAEIKQTANELLDSLQDSRFSETEFLNFVDKLKAESDCKNSFNITTEQDKIWKDSRKTFHTANIVPSEEEKWVDEFQKLASESDSKLSFWENLNDEWNSASKSQSNHPWLDDFQRVFDSYKCYEFDKNNSLESHPNPFEEGLERLKSSDIVNAVLLFEAAVQKEPEHMLAWQYLGTTQVENEQDVQAIRALRKCLELQSDNLIALSTLATSYTNESMQRLAFDCLHKWLIGNPKYKSIVKNKILPEFKQPNMSSLSIVHIKDFLDLQELYLQAIRESSNKIDPDLQCCLGVLFHLSGEYDKASDCFKTALQVKQDHILWNKLGATYANSNRNEEAIEAYYQALKLCPGFVRARYNLGIACMNLGAYQEAVEHFLTSLSQQNQANAIHKNGLKSTVTSETSTNQMSETIWSTLRLALSYLNRVDLYDKCFNKDLVFLKKQFKIE